MDSENRNLYPTPESGEHNFEQIFSTYLVKDTKLKRLTDDPEVREAAIAGFRTLMNVGVSFIDAIPVVGDAVSTMVDIGKLTKKTNLTPDVSKKVAWGSEALEFCSLGFMPTHIFETAIQMKHDLPRMIGGFRRARQILTTENVDYMQNRSQIDTAMQTFGVEPPNSSTINSNDIWNI